MTSSGHLFEDFDAIGDGYRHLRDTGGPPFPQIVTIQGNVVPQRHVLPDELNIVALDSEVILGWYVFGSTAYHAFHDEIILHAAR